MTKFLLKNFIKLKTNISEKFVKLNEKIDRNDYHKQLKTIYNKFTNIRNYVNLKNYHLSSHVTSQKSILKINMIHLLKLYIRNYQNLKLIYQINMLNNFFKMFKLLFNIKFIINIY